MILIPFANTLHVQKEGNISVENITLRITSDLNIQDPMICFDKDKYYKFKPGMKIPKEYHSIPTLHMKLKCVIDGAARVFPAPQLPLTVYTLVGKTVRDAFPIAIQQVLDKQDEILRRLMKVEAEVDYGNL